MTELEECDDDRAFRRDVGTLPVIETAGLVLRPPRMADAPALADLADNPNISRNLSRMPNPYRLEDAERWIADEAGIRDHDYLVFVRGDDNRLTLVGAVGLNRRDHSGEAAAGLELGYWIGEAYWGRGYATEAAHALIDFGFVHLKLSAIAAACRVTNQASRRVIEKCGFRFEGQGFARSSYFQAVVPTDRFRLERATWLSLRSWRTATVSPPGSRRATRELTVDRRITLSGDIA